MTAALGTWDDAAASSLRQIVEWCSTTDFGTAMTTLRATFNKQPAQAELEIQYLELGSAGWAELVESTPLITTPTEAHLFDDTVALLARKQHDYGTGNILGFGHAGLAIRLHDKLCRFVNLQGRTSDPENESIIDTLTDIVGYCVVGLMLLAKTFELPLQRDVKAERLRELMRNCLLDDTDLAEPNDWMRCGCEPCAERRRDADAEQREVS